MEIVIIVFLMGFFTVCVRRSVTVKEVNDQRLAELERNF